MIADNKATVKEMRVKGSSPVSTLMGSILKSLEEVDRVDVITVGASALNQATKAWISAKAALATKGNKLQMTQSFSSTEIEGKEVTSIVTTLTVVPY